MQQIYPITQLKTLLKNKHTKQASVLYLSMIFGIILGFTVSIINTRLLDVDSYGKLKFIQTILTLLATVVSFGFSYSTGRLIALDININKKYQLIAAAISIDILLSILAGLFLIVFSFFINDLFDTDISKYVLIIAPFAFVSIFQNTLGNCLQGLNRIYSLAALRIAPRALYITGCLTFISFFNFSLLSALLLQWGLSALITIYYIKFLKSDFSKIKKSLLDIFQENKTNGFPVYTGSLAAVGSAQLIGIFLGYQSDMQSVGFYSLALIVAAPLQFIPSVLGTTLFKSFANRTSIPLKVFIATLFITILILTVYWISLEHILILAYSERYLPVVPYAKILLVGMVFHGLGDLINRFLGAHGRGKELRNAAFAVCFVIIVGSLYFIPQYGPIAAAITKAFSSFAYFSIIGFYYIIFQKIKKNV